MKKDYFVLLFLQEDTNTLYSYQKYYLEKLLMRFSSVTIVGSQKIDLKHLPAGVKMISVSSEVKNRRKFVLEHLDMGKIENLVLADDSNFGPFFDFENIFSKMGERKLDCWAMLRHAPKQGESALLDGSFLVLKSRFLHQHTAMALLKDEYNLPTEKLDDMHLSYGCYAQTDAYDLPKGQNNFNYTNYYALELIRDQQYPFLPISSFTNSENLDYSHGENASNALDWVGRHCDYPSDFIAEKLLYSFDISALRESLRLYYIVNDKPNPHRASAGRAAVFMHLFYPDLLDETLLYAKQIPEAFDLYISTNGLQQQKKIEQEFAAMHRKVVVLQAGKRGRDAGALLVAFRPYLMRYEYVCFVHDKKTSGGAGPRMTGDTFRAVVFENLLGNPDYLYNILDLFEENPKLGFLSPPCPAIGSYQKFSGGFGNEWTQCFDATKGLADRLHIQTPISNEYRPLAISNTFWGRTKALKTLFEYPFTFFDFLEEPLPSDGTLNHAIERIYPYVAQDAGYTSGILLSDHFAVSYIVSIDSSLASLLQAARTHLNVGISDDIMETIRSVGDAYLPLLRERNTLRSESSKKENYISDLQTRLGKEQSQRRLLEQENKKKEAYIIELQKKESRCALLECENVKKEQYIMKLTQQLQDKHKYH